MARQPDAVLNSVYDKDSVFHMLPVKIQYPDGAVYYFYRSDKMSRPKGRRIIFPRSDTAKAAKFLSKLTASQIARLLALLERRDLSRASPRKALAKAISNGRIYIYEIREEVDTSEAEMASLRLEIKLLLKQIVSIEIAEAAEIEKGIEDKNLIEKVLIYRREFNKGAAKAALELLTWVKDVYEVVSPTQNLKRALEAGWETYQSDSKDWQETYYTKLKASNYREVVEALGFDPSAISKEQIVEIFEFAQLVYEDEKTQEIILQFMKDYAGAQHSLEWTSFAGGAAFDVVLTALLAFFTAGTGAVASIGAKTGRLMRPLAKLGEKITELAKKLSKAYKPKKKPKTRVGSSSKNNAGKGTKKSDKPSEKDQDTNEKIESDFIDIELDANGNYRGNHNAGPNTPVFKDWIDNGGTVKYNRSTDSYIYGKQMQTSQAGNKFVEVEYKPGPPDGDRYPDFTEHTSESVQIEGMSGVSEKSISPPEGGDFSKGWEELEAKNGDGFVEENYGINRRVKGDRLGQFPDKSPRGYTWHHVQDGETLQLVDKNVHSAFPHKGGASLSR